ncbi:MAG: GNAT family N-acetyltransferase [Mycobacteriales bacterium]
MTDTAAVLDALENFYDGVPRTAADPHDLGPLTLFVARQGWPYYARPRLGGRDPISADDVAAVRARQRELKVPEAFEWVHEVTPSLAGAARATGLHVHEHPLMVLDAFRPVAPPDGVAVRVLDADSPDLVAARAVADVGFSAPGTAAGEPGTVERDRAAAAIPPAQVEHVRDRIRRGLLVSAVAGRDGTGPLCVGSYQAVDLVAEIVGVATLPAARRGGLAAAVTSAVVGDAFGRGVQTVFLSAGDEDVARMYRRLGFVRVGTACIAEPL